MSTHFDHNRRMIPRWQTSEQAIAGGTATSLTAHRNAATAAADEAERGNELSTAPAGIASLAGDWEATHRIGYAADLVSAAFVGDDSAWRHHAVIDAANFIVDSRLASPLLRQVAEKVLQKHRPTGVSSSPSVAQRVEGRTWDGAGVASVREHRAATRRYPYDPFRWVDLARAHVTLGNNEAAERAMRTALTLTPDHRFVLRAAVRLLIHIGSRKPEAREEAWLRITRASAVKSDPWLAAAEIGVAMVMKRAPRHIKAARLMLESGDHSAFDKSELGGALGSLEIDSGAIRKGRRLFHQALIAPTENTLAQAAWLKQNASIDLFTENQADLSASAEGQVWEQFRCEEWRRAVVATVQWTKEEPFSRRPYLMGTFLAAGVLGNFALGAKLGEAGIRSNPHDATIRNNLAFSYASLGRPDEAEQVLAPLDLMDLDTDDRIACVATWGLINYRQNRPEEGRKIYELAMGAAHRLRMRETECLAAIYFAREEWLSNQPGADSALELATQLFRRTPKPYLKSVLSQVESLRRGGAPQVKSLNEAPAAD